VSYNGGTSNGKKERKERNKRERKKGILYLDKPESAQEDYVVIVIRKIGSREGKRYEE